jgi:hypothetical protein
MIKSPERQFLIHINDKLIPYQILKYWPNYYNLIIYLLHRGQLFLIFSEHEKHKIICLHGKIIIYR